VWGSTGGSSRLDPAICTRPRRLADAPIWVTIKSLVAGLVTALIFAMRGQVYAGMHD
jgi:hypothetical protein